jgi:adenylate cyclase
MDRSNSLSAADTQETVGDFKHPIQKLLPVSGTDYAGGIAGSGVYWSARRYDQAIEQHEKALDLEPNNAQAHAFLGVDYLCKSRHGLAIAALQKSVQLSQGAPLFVASLGEAYAAAGYRDEAQKILEQLQQVSKQRYVTPNPVALIYAALARKDEALRWLETAYQQHAEWMVLLKVDPRYDDLRPDPRFQNLLRRMNFPA